MKPFLMIGLLAAATVVMSGCDGAWWRPAAAHQARDFSTYADPALDEIDRLAMVPLFLAGGIAEGAQIMDQSLRSSIAQRNRFELVALDHADRERLFAADPLRHNRLDTESLRRLRSEFGVDAVIIGRLTHWHSYDPVALALTLHIVDCRDARILWSATGTWDSGQRAVQDDIRAWYQARQGRTNEALGGWRTVLSSPSAMSNYVSDRLAASVPRRQ